MSVYEEDYDPREEPDRVFYAPGVFLDAEDMQAEQRYHRGRLTRVLTYLHGTGTAAGLRVDHDTERDVITVEPGLAIDRLGRLIEVPRTACLDLDRWFEYHADLVRKVEAGEADAEEAQKASDFLQARNATDDAIVADVYVRFVVCSRGRTPAFATGPWDAIDATVPHRLRDSYELTLEMRGGDDQDLLPRSEWPSRGDYPDFDAWMADMRETVLDAWKVANRNRDEVRADPPASAIGIEDHTAVFLARVSIPITMPAAGDPDEGVPQRVPDVKAEVDNDSRLLVWPTAALLKWMDALHTP